MSKFKSHIPEPKAKTAAEMALEYVVFVVGSVFIYYTIVCVLKFIFAPVRYLTMSSDEIEQERLEKAKEKIQNRTRQREVWAHDESDPLNWYVEHCLNKEGSGRNYSRVLKWHRQWSKGRILDTRMRWAPEVYEGTEESRHLSLAFVKYLERQLELHRAAGLMRWAGFAYTLNRFYPEVSVGLDTLKERARVASLGEKLVSEIADIGLSREVAGTLASLDVSGKRLHEIVTKVKALKKKGLTDTGLEFYIKYYDLMEKSPVISDVKVLVEIDQLLCKGVPDDIIMEYLNGQLSLEDLLQVLRDGMGYVDLVEEVAYGTNSRTGEMRLHEFMREIARQRKAEHRKEVLNSFGG